MAQAVGTDEKPELLFSVSVTGTFMACDSGTVGAKSTEPFFNDCNRKEACAEEIGRLGAQPTRMTDAHRNAKSLVCLDLLCMCRQVLTNQHKTTRHPIWTPPAMKGSHTGRERQVWLSTWIWCLTRRVTGDWFCVDLFVQLSALHV